MVWKWKSTCLKASFLKTLWKVMRYRRACRKHKRSSSRCFCPLTPKGSIVMQRTYRHSMSGFQMQSALVLVPTTKCHCCMAKLEKSRTRYRHGCQTCLCIYVYRSYLRSHKHSKRMLSFFHQLLIPLRLSSSTSAKLPQL